VTTDGEHPSGLAADNTFLRLAPRPITHAGQLTVATSDTGDIRVLTTPERLAPPALHVVESAGRARDTSTGAADLLRVAAARPARPGPTWTPTQVVGYRRDRAARHAADRRHGSAVGGCSVAPARSPRCGHGDRAPPPARAPFSWLTSLPDMDHRPRRRTGPPGRSADGSRCRRRTRWWITVAGGTFAGRAPPGARTDPRSLTVSAYAADDTLLYKGPRRRVSDARRSGRHCSRRGHRPPRRRAPTAARSTPGPTQSARAVSLEENRRTCGLTRWRGDEIGTSRTSAPLPGHCGAARAICRWTTRTGHASASRAARRRKTRRDLPDQPALSPRHHHRHRAHRRDRHRRYNRPGMGHQLRVSLAAGVRSTGWPCADRPALRGRRRQLPVPGRDHSGPVAIARSMAPASTRGRSGRAGRRVGQAPPGGSAPWRRGSGRGGGVWVSRSWRRRRGRCGGRNPGDGCDNRPGPARVPGANRERISSRSRCGDHSSR